FEYPACPIRCPMPEPANLDPDLSALAAALASLSPATPALDRDRLFYEAGRRAAHPRAWSWPLAAGLCASLAFGVGVHLATTAESARGPQVVYVHVPVPAPESPSSPAIVTTVADRRFDHPVAEALRLR